jgi:hypothetical protein
MIVKASFCKKKIPINFILKWPRHIQLTLPTNMHNINTTATVQQELPLPENLCDAKVDRWSNLNYPAKSRCCPNSHTKFLSVTVTTVVTVGSVLTQVG